MSGSLMPKRAISAHLSLRSARSRMVFQFALMSFVVRQEWENVACMALGVSRNGSVEMNMSRPVAFTASAKFTKRALPRPYCPQLSYLT